MNYRLKRQLSELRSLVKLATPVTLGHLALMGIGVTDVIVAGRAGVSDLAGVALGNSVWVLIIYFFFGISIANQPLISELFGRRDFSALRFQFHQSLWMSILTGVVSIVAVLAGAELLGFLNSDAVANGIARDYLQVMALGAVTMTLLPVLRTTLESINQTKVVLVINTVTFLLNIPLDIALVHGLWGLPKLGGVGCAWASISLLWFSVAVTYLVLVLRKKNRVFGFAGKLSPMSMPVIFKTLKLGVPIGFSILIELGLFSGAAVVIATLGDVEVGAHSVAISAASVAYMIYFGIGQAMTILAARRLGEGRPLRAVQGIYFGIRFAILISIIFSLMIVLLRTQIASLYSDDQAVILLAAQLLIWSAVFQTADAVQVTAICGLRAFKETASPPRYQIISFWLIAFPMGYLFSVVGIWEPMSGPHGFWLAMTSGLVLVAVLIYLKLRRYTRLSEKLTPVVAARDAGSL